MNSFFVKSALKAGSLAPSTSSEKMLWEIRIDFAYKPIIVLSRFRQRFAHSLKSLLYY